MKENLVIIESSGKSSAITKYLNNSPALAKYGKFVVIACFGFIRDLAKKNLGIDIEHEFKPTYEFIKEKKDSIDKIIKAAKTADEIYLASDADDSGEAIAESIRILLNLGENYKRLKYTEITQSALEYAVTHPTRIDNLQVESQLCQRILDRLVGFKLSPLLWKKFTSGSVTLSAGRVQSAVMHLIVQREKEIEAFKSSPYWHLHGNFTLDKTKLEDVNLYKDTTIYKTEKQSDVTAFFKSLKNIWEISDVKARTTKQSPDPPFITSSLQQEASGKLRMGIKRIMAVAQELYEGGYITYMRTDSFNMSDTFKEQAKTYILKTFGEDYHSGGDLKKKAIKGAQEAHECIRITDVNVTELPAKFGKDQRELYELIWKRTVAFLMTQAQHDELELNIIDTGMAKNMKFKTTFKRVKFNGYLIVYGVKNETNDFANYMNALKAGKYNLSCESILAKNTWQSPPARYNDAGLVKLMETNGIGRPSTISSIIEKLFDKIYVIKTEIKGTEQPTEDFNYNPSSKVTKSIKGTTFVGAESGKVKPTDIGIEIDTYLSDKFDYIVDKDFTATIETDLDKIAAGTATRLEVLTKFWDKFSKNLDTELKKKEDKRIIESESREVILDGKTYKVRVGPYGPLVEYEKGGKKTYIGLKGYLSMVKKEYLDIDAVDIKYLLDLPKVLTKINSKDVTLLIGPYGPYLKYDGTNVKIPHFALKDFAETKTFTAEQLKGFIEYAQANKKTTTKSAAKSSSSQDNEDKPTKPKKYQTPRSLKPGNQAKPKSAKEPKEPKPKTPKAPKAKSA